MAFPWRTRRRGPKRKEDKRLALSAAAASEEFSVPAHFQCPISLEIMEDPVTAPTGITYDRRSIEAWLDRGNGTCPVTSLPLGPDADLLLIPNHSLRRMIQEWTAAHGPTRVPTPRAPLTRADAADLASEMSAAARDGDWPHCERLASAGKRLARESERNRRCFVSAGAARSVAFAFRAFAEGISVDRQDRPLALEEEMISLLAALPRPLTEAAVAEDLGAPASLRRLAAVMRHGREPAAAAVLVRELVVGSNGMQSGAVAAAEGMVEALVELIKKPVSSQATKASLVAVFYIIKDESAASSRAIELGLVGSLVETLVDADRGACEKALGVLDELVGLAQGREAARGHALAVPALVKKMFRVSEAATEMAVSAMWKLCSGEEEVGRCAEELLQAGVFQKLLLLLQIGCSEEAKEKATDLLRALNECRGREECIDTTDFKGLKRIQ
ncbi:U-box domain-containing protein 20-like [Curcuma longa]|uniref:U-box domain-containing protein 20-like n=1 Tax=Curcuma longa TaxID=136217 RepID=UPI003D9DC1DD